jgi:poly-gamma-glutamate capsule biosynthesis protein CapA/YwtB (metallophosphatase superfamily)
VSDRTPVRITALAARAHGTHAIGPVERRGQTVIAWGLGNLAFACDCTREAEGLILRVALTPQRTSARVIPITAGLGGRSARPSHEHALMLELVRKLGSTAVSARGEL